MWLDLAMARSYEVHYRPSQELRKGIFTLSTYSITYPTFDPRKKRSRAIYPDTRGVAQIQGLFEEIDGNYTALGTRYAAALAYALQETKESVAGKIYNTVIYDDLKP